MSTDTDEIVARAANGNAEAHAFLVGWHRYCHALDDVVDLDAEPSAAILVGRWANELYSMPFYQRHQCVLGPLVQLITCTYEDSVIWQNASLPWRQHEADVIRHAGADMVRMVAYLTGGYACMRAVSLDLRDLCYREHHDSEGKPQ